MKSGGPRRLAAVGLLFGVVAASFVAGCTTRARPSGHQGKLTVVCSINVVEDLVRNVGGDSVQTSSLVTGLENPHTFAPTPADSKQLARADVFFQIGLGLEPWAAGLLQASGNSKLRVVSLSDGLRRLRSVREEGHADEHPAEHRSSHEEEGVNPHVWMDPENAARMTDSIAAALAQLDPARTERFRENAAAYKRRLAALGSELRSRAASLKARRVAAYAPNFAYLLRRLKVEEVLTVQLACSEEPSAKRMSRIVEEMKRRGDIKVLVTTPQYSDIIPRQIARETGAKLVYLTPMLDDDPGTRTYLEMIRTDAERVFRALEPE